MPQFRPEEDVEERDVCYTEIEEKSEYLDVHSITCSRTVTDLSVKVENELPSSEAFFDGSFSS